MTKTKCKEERSAQKEVSMKQSEDNHSKQNTGFPSIDKPWLKYYSEEAINAPSADCSLVDFLYICNRGYLNYTALNYFGTKITYQKLFENIDKVASALQASGVKKGDIVSICSLNTPEFVYLLYAVNKVGAVSNWLGLTSPVSDLHEQIVSTDCKMIFVIEMAYDKIREAVKDSQVEQIITVPVENSMPKIMGFVVSRKNKHPHSDVIKWNDFLKTSTGRVEPPDVKSHEMAMIEYTGGSTGVPKGVMLSNKSLNSYYVNFNKAIH